MQVKITGNGSMCDTTISTEDGEIPNVIGFKLEHFAGEIPVAYIETLAPFFIFSAEGAFTQLEIPELSKEELQRCIDALEQRKIEVSE